MSVEIDKKFFDPSFPLLDKFREVASGSHKHCQNVSNICESIAVELDLNIDLIKCSALYHDIGKMNNPGYFSENQSNGNNPHNDLTPLISYSIVSRHVGDSVLYLLQIPEIPREVIEIVSQHHGNTVLMAFFNKAKSEPEDLFRYKSGRPRTTEASVLMIVDSVEATARALFNNHADEEDKSEFIHTAIISTVDRLSDDDQLDTMQIGTLKVVKKILFKELESIYHKRVMYEDKSPTVAEVKSIENNSDKNDNG